MQQIQFPFKGILSTEPTWAKDQMSQVCVQTALQLSGILEKSQDVFQNRNR